MFIGWWTFWRIGAGRDEAFAIMRFAAIPLEVLADHRLSHRQLRVLLALYSFKAKDSAEVWPKRQTLATRCGLPLTRISQVTTELQALGWLSKIGAGGCSCPTHYTLTIPQNLADSTETAPVGNAKTVTESVTVTDSVTVTKTVTPTVTKTVTGKEQTIEHKEVGDAHARESDGAGFASFWAAYPRKKDKAAALKAWHRLKPSADLQAIIQSDLSQRPRRTTSGSAASSRTRGPTSMAIAGKTTSPPYRSSPMHPVADLLPSASIALTACHSPNSAPHPSLPEVNESFLEKLFRAFQAEFGTRW
jgi:hypothetical protein